MTSSLNKSAATRWSALRPFVAAEARLGTRMARRPGTAFLYEFLRFGMKQAWACLFGGIMVALILGTHFWYPADAALARYDVLVIAAVIVQALLLYFGLETWEEAKVILLYHVVGTIMEIFKTGVGSWIYPEPGLLKIAGVPLFSGFMYACIGSYIARAWRLFDFQFTRHPPLWALAILSVAIYVNFFSHHYIVDFRLGLFVAIALLFGRTRIYYTIWQTPRWMPLLLGLVLVAFFIWVAENVGTLSRTWLYPNQLHQWSAVPIQKLGAWLLLMSISYTMVAFINRPRQKAANEAPAGPLADAA